jgi:hypothetical protein
MALAKPTNVVAQIQSQQAAHITWTNGAAYDEVQWEKRVAGGSWYGGGIYGYAATEAQDNGLEDGTAYEWHVRGWTSDPEEYSDWSDVASGITPLGDPYGMSGTCLSPTSIKVWWVDNAQHEANYILQRALGQSGEFSDYQTLGANVVEYTDIGLTIGMWYRYRVKATNALTSSNYSNEVSVFTTDPPNAPSNLTGQATGKTTVHLGFQDNSTNETSFRILIYPPGGPWSEWGYVGANVTEADITGLTQNTAYSFLVKARGDGGDSDYSNQVNITTFADIAQPTNLTVTVLSGIAAFLRFQDNSELEDDHRVEEKVGGGAFAEIATLPANVFGYRRTGLTPGTTLTYRVRAKQGAAYSSYSNEVQVTTMTVPGQVTGLRLNRMPIIDPNLEKWTDAVTPTMWTVYKAGSSTVNREGSDKISGDYALRFDVDASGSAASIYQAATLIPGKKYKLSIWLKSTAANKRARVSFSTNDSKFYLGSDGAWQEGGTNVFYSDVLTWTKFEIQFEPIAGYTAYILTLRAGVAGEVSYSVYCDKIFFQALDAQDYQPDIEMRLEWDATATAAGYKVERSTNGTAYTQVAKIDVPEYLGIGLTPGTKYWWRILAYNAQGDAASYSLSQSEITEATYERTALEHALRNRRARLCYLAEVNPLIELSGFTLTGGKTYTYEILFGEDGADIDAVYENGTAYAKKTSIADVESTATSYFWDYFARKLYVHTSAGTTPANFQILASFWIFFSGWRTKDAPAAWGNTNYLGLLKQGEIPDITSDVTPYYESSPVSSFGTLSLMNAKIRGAYYFDRRYRAYCWRGRKTVFKYGKPGAHLSEYRPFFTGMISPEEGAVACNDRRFTAQLVDLRTNLQKIIPVHRFKTSEFPALPTDLIDKSVPRSYGTVTDGRSFCVDLTNRIFVFNDGRVKQIDAVKQNETTMVSGTDYTGLADLGMLVIHKATTWAASDQITVNFVGCVNAADEKIELAADIFKHFCKAEFTMVDAEFENDSIARTRNAKTQALKLVIGADFNSDDVLRTLEHSINGYIFQDGSGRLGIRPAETAARSGAPRIRDHQIHDYGQTAGPVFLGVNVYYDQNPKTEEWKVETKTISTNAWKARAQKMLDILTALSSQSDASAMGTEIIALLDKDFPEIEVAGLLMQVNAGDVVPYTRTRAYNLSGTANEALLRVYSITKSIAGKRTRIRGEIVA